jgi:hypothetical protein
MRNPPEPRYVISTESLHDPEQRATGCGTIVGLSGTRLAAQAVEAMDMERIRNCWSNRFTAGTNLGQQVRVNVAAPE